MPVTIGEFEVIAEPASTPTPGSTAGGTTGGDAAPADPRPAALQQAIQSWQAIETERLWRLDDR